MIGKSVQVNGVSHHFLLVNGVSHHFLLLLQWRDAFRTFDWYGALGGNDIVLKNLLQVEVSDST